MRKLHVFLILTHLLTLPILSMQQPDNLVQYQLCETNNLQTNAYRKNLQIATSDGTWSASLLENMTSYATTRATLIDETTGKYLITLARAIQAGEDIAKDHTIIQERLNQHAQQNNIQITVTDQNANIRIFAMPLNLKTSQKRCKGKS